MPISCHFQDCKALLATNSSHVRSAIAGTEPYFFKIRCLLAYFLTCFMLCYVQTGGERRKRGAEPGPWDTWPLWRHAGGVWRRESVTERFYVTTDRHRWRKWQRTCLWTSRLHDTSLRERYSRCASCQSINYSCL